MVTKVNAKPKITKQIPRKVPLFRKANWSDFKTYIMTEKKNEILNLQQSSIEEIWTAFKTALQKGITQFVPIKKIGCKKSLPWITQEIKRLIRPSLINSLFAVTRPMVLGLGRSVGFFFFFFWTELKDNIFV